MEILETVKLESLKEIANLSEETSLQGEVAEWLMEYINIDLESEEITDDLIEESWDNVNSALSDLLSYGCVNGMVGKLIHYYDTIAFHDKHEDEIWDMLYDQAKEMGLDSALDMANSLNGADDVCDMTRLKNLLSWYAFEETARILADELDMEI